MMLTVLLIAGKWFMRVRSRLDSALQLFLGSLTLTVCLVLLMGAAFGTIYCFGFTDYVIFEFGLLRLLLTLLTSLLVRLLRAKTLVNFLHLLTI